MFSAFVYQCDGFSQVDPAVSAAVKQKPVEKEKLKVKFIGGSFKFLAKTYTSVIDLEKFKKRNITVINKMPDQKFRKHFAERYILLKELPFEYINEYKITKNMSKAQVIESIKLLDKKQIYRIINALPNKVIADNFKIYMHGRQEDGCTTEKKRGLICQITGVWKDATDSVNGKGG